ncbi:MAG: tripartite tricarboxylate transporter substrate-binding protein [Beijerinckiaceae bacterium]|nr:tripartite tricarboxylate transporter substrate-binding protein [Beijerinckiaceae bacterium]
MSCKRNRATSRVKTLACAGALAAMLLAPSSAFAASPEDFPVRRVNFYIGFAAGGYDSYARLLTRHMGRYLPGSPDVVPMNMPGAGSVKLVQYLNSAAPADGSAMGIIDRGLFVAIFTNPAIPKFDFPAMKWIGSITNENLLCVSWHASPVKVFEDMLTRDFVTGGVTQGVAWTSAAVMQKMLGAKLKFISGYPGGNEILIAMERGELDGRCAWSHSSVMTSRPDWIAEKKINVLLQYALTRSPELPDVPTTLEVAKDDRQRDIIRFLFAPEAVARPIVAPPGLNPARLAILRKGFLDTMADKAFRAEADKLGMDINPTSGDRLAEIISEIAQTPPDIIEEARELLKQ